MSTNAAYGGQVPMAQEVPMAAPVAQDYTGEYAEGSVASKGSINYEGSKYQDVWALVAWLVSVVAVIGCAVAFSDDLFAYTDSQGTDDFVTDDATYNPINTEVLIAAVIAGCIFAGIWSWGWLKIMQRYAGNVIWTGIVLNCIAWVVFSVAFFALTSSAAGLVFLIMVAFLLLYYYCVRSKIPLAEACLKISSECIQANPSVVTVSIAFAFLSIIWILVWEFAAAGYYVNATDGLTQEISGGGYAGLILLVLCFYWSAEVFKNIGHVTTAGTCATWWFWPQADGKVRGALCRALTTSLGSICLGSLIVAILKTLRYIVRQLMEDRNMAALYCILLCILDCITGLMQYFNKYAYTYVAIYGDGFMAAGKKTWDLFKSAGFDAIINDDLSGLALGLGIFFGVILSGFVGLALAYLFEDCKTNATCILVTVILCMFCSFFLVNISMACVASCVTTTFVLWAEDPAAINAARPDKVALLRDAVNKQFETRRDKIETARY